MSPRVSILLPYRNAIDTLEEAVSSVLVQDVDGELLAIDDGSIDDSAAEVERIVEAHRRSTITVRHLKTDGIGIVGALELARPLAKAALLARMDADDICLAGRLRSQCDAFDADHDLHLLGTRVEAFGAPGEGIRRYVAWQNTLMTAAQHEVSRFVESPLCHPSVMMRAATLEALGGYCDGDFPEDYELWLRFAAHGHRMRKLPEVGVRWRHADGRLTFTDPRYRPAAFTAIKAKYLARALPSPRVRVWGAGRTGKHFVRALETHGVGADVFFDIDPNKIGRTARGAPILSLDAIHSDERPLLVALGARGARADACAHLEQRGFRQGFGAGQFICVA